MTSPKTSRLIREYIEKTPKSQALNERARQLFPSGVTHDSRLHSPYPISVERAAGSCKWDVDGNEYVDFFGGHGALIMGHGHPAIVEAVQEQVARGTHYGSSHEIEIEWAELIMELVPCAEKVRFTSSGTEATLLAMRIARAFVQKSKILRFETNFHGWHDQVAFASTSHFDGSLPSGITPESTSNIALCPPNDIDRVKQILAADDDIAAVIIEPTGAAFGHLPTPPEFVRQLGEVTAQYGVLLIFDEVICGFRLARGGAQEFLGVTPDLATLAKVMAGGLPGGAVVGSSEIMDMLTVKADPEWNTKRRIAHFGTYNANPLTAAAGRRQLEMIKTTDIGERATRNAQMVRDAMNSVIREEGLNWIAYGISSDLHIFLNHNNLDVTAEDIQSGKVHYSDMKAGNPTPLVHEFRSGMLAQGIDVSSWPGGFVSAVHTADDVEHTARALKYVLGVLKEEQVHQPA